MVDVVLEYGYYIVGIGVAIVAGIVSYFTARKSMRDWREEQRNELNTLVTNQVDRVIDKIDSSDKVMNEKFIRTDQVLKNASDDIDEISTDVEQLQQQFNKVCYTLGKHDYVIDKILPEYLNLKNSISDFKSVVDSKILTKKDDDVTNNEDEYGK